MQDTGSGFVSTLESLAQSFVVASVLWMMFLVVAWPFVTVSRLVFYIGSFGSVKPTYRQALEHQGIVGLAFLIFVPFFSMCTSFMGPGSMAISQTEFNKARHGDAYYIAASPPFRSRACWLALNK